MSPHNLITLVPWIIAHGYLIFFVAAVIEGPLTTIGGGVVASLGYFNIFIVLALAILADIGADIVYYWIGYRGHNLVGSSFFRYFGLSKERVDKMRRLLHIHTNYALMLVKFSPIIGPIGLVTIGVTRLKFKKFFWAALKLSVPKSFFLVFLGYYFGESYQRLNKMIAQGPYIILGLIILISLIYFIYLKIMANITRKIER